MDRRDFYFQQLVTEADLDEVFELAEAADHNYVIDNGLVGVYFGLDVAEAGVPNLTVQVSAGAAYDQTGQRIAVPSTQIVNVAVDSNAVSTTVAGVGNSKIISVYAKFKRVLGNPKTDGNNVSVQYDRDESYEFIVRQSTEAVGPTPPSLQADEILLADITRVFGGTTVVNSAVSTTRRQWAISATSGSYSVKTGRVDTAIQSVVELIDGLDTDVADHIADPTAAHAASAIANTPAGTIAATTVQAAINELATDAVADTAALAAHLADATDAHASSAISLASRTAWLGGRTNPDATLQAGVDKIITDLAVTDTSDDGMERIGGAATAGSPRSLSSGSARSQADALLGYVNDLEKRTAVVWGRFSTNGLGSISILDSEGVASALVTPGYIEVTFSTAFANTSYAPLVTSLGGAGTNRFYQVNSSTLTTTTLRVYVITPADEGTVNPSTQICAFSLEVKGRRP